MPLPFSVAAPPRASAQPPRALAAGAVVGLALLQLAIGVALLAVFEAYKVFYFTTFAPSWYQNQMAAREQFIQQQQQQQPQTGGGGGGTDGGHPQRQPYDLGPLTPAPGDPHDWRSPMAIVFLLALVSNTVAIAGIAGVRHDLQQLIVAFFVYSAFATVALAHLFVDMLVESKIDYGAALMGGGEGGQGGGYGGGGGAAAPPSGPPGPSAYEKAAAALVFVQMIASAGATVLSLRAAEEVRRRRQYKHMGDLASNLAFEPDA